MHSEGWANVAERGSKKGEWFEKSVGRWGATLWREGQLNVMYVYMCGVGLCAAWSGAVADSRWLVLLLLEGPIDPHLLSFCVCWCACENVHECHCFSQLSELLLLHSSISHHFFTHAFIMKYRYYAGNVSIWEKLNFQSNTQEENQPLSQLFTEQNQIA